MNILNDNTDINSHTKPEQELVEQEKQEYKLLGTYLRTRGLNLYSYNPINSEIKEVEITVGDTVHMVSIEGKLTWIDFESEKTTVDSRMMYFECLNFGSAKNRVRKYKNGTIKELCNLKEPSKEGIKFW